MPRAYQPEVRRNRILTETDRKGCGRRDKERQKKKKPGRWRKNVSSLGGTRKRKIAERRNMGSRKREILPGRKKIP